MTTLVQNYNLKAIRYTWSPNSLTPPNRRQTGDTGPSDPVQAIPEHQIQGQPARQNQQKLSNSVQTAATQFTKQNQVQNPHATLHCSCGDLLTFWEVKPHQTHWGERK